MHENAVPSATNVPVPLSRNRDFNLLWAGQGLSALGSAASYIAYPLLILALTRSAADVGLVAFVEGLPAVLLALPAGLLVDRYDRRRTMLVCDAARLLILAAVALLVWRHHIALGYLAVAAFAEGAFSIVFTVASTVTLSAVVPQEQIGAAAGRQQARDTAAVLVGGPIGGALFSVARFVPFLADAVSYLFSFVGVALIRTPGKPDDTETEVGTGTGTGLLSELAQGLRFIRRTPFIRATALLGGAVNCIGAALMILCIISIRSHGASATGTGVFLSIAGAGGICGGLLAPKLADLLSERAVHLGTVWLWAVLIPLMALTSNPYLLGLIGAGVAFPMPAWYGVVLARTFSTTPDEMQGRVQSVNRLLSQGLSAVGPLLAGAGYATLGASGVDGVLAVAALLTALTSTFTSALRALPPLTDDLAPGRLDLEPAHEG